ncbi:MAG: sulfatase-like hydrolase/transferase [Prolixibacteraceae bacterium]|nr:sulfatase-like hydrolase/transferase [Prolixibacteraceae bacterium]
MDHTPPFQYLLRQSIKRFISLSLLMTLLIILVRFYEILFISGKAGYPAGSTSELMYGIRFDLSLSLRLSVILLIPFLIIDHFSIRAARIFFGAITAVVVGGEILLLQYFATTRTPLGSDLLGYSAAEIKQTVDASGQFSLTTFAPVLILLGITWYLFHKLYYFKIAHQVIRFYILSLILAFLPIGRYNPDPVDYKNEFSLNIAANKFNLFSGSMLTYFSQTNEPSNFELNGKTQVAEDIKPDGVQLSNLNEPLIQNTGNSLNPENPFTYLSQDYPFLHKESTPDVLAPFFKSDTTAPSIVFILVESLGRAYCGEGAYLGSFTPFLDSLMAKSLYWENCLSTSGRTFSVLPSMLGSLPFGEKGFADLGDKMPDHLSLISLLINRAGYTSSFYYGGDTKFDAMEPFLRREGTTKIVGIHDYGTEYKQLPSDKNGYSWGYGDLDIFKKYLTDLKSHETEKRVDVMLTLSMHNPFMVPDQQHYNDLVEKRMAEQHLTEDQKKYNRQYIPQFATMFYFDDALRYFFQEISKLRSYENTIFVITGDHRMPEIPISTQLDRFHVPLVIYSPMLKMAEAFSSIVTHYDVTPSLLAWLKDRIHLTLPSVTSWIGHGLDTNPAFRNLNEYPLKRNTGELTDYISGDHFISGSTLYKVYPDLNIEPENNPALNDQLQKQFANYKAKNNFATKGNQLIPDSIKKYNRP